MRVAQFIYNAVAANCVEVATHRHGCCVLQRCIDHASEHQRVQLVNEITYNALTLVQDPYGNYVSFLCLAPRTNSVRSVLILMWLNTAGGAIHSRLERQPLQRRGYPPVHGQRVRPLCSEVQLKRHREGAGMPSVDASFLGSSNGIAILKCIRVAEHTTRKMLIGELLNRTRLEKLLRDSYGNYCVQVRPSIMPLALPRRVC